MLDIEEPHDLQVYLRERGWIGAGETPVVERLGGGVSGRVMLVRSAGGREIVLKQALETLRVRERWTSDPRRVHCEAAGMRVLRELGVPVAHLLFEDFDHHLIGMTAAPRPHETWKRHLLEGDVRRDHVDAFAAMLSAIHTRSAVRVDALADAFAGCGYFESLRIEPYYRFTATQVPETRPFFDALIRDTLSIRAALVHGDFSPKNVLVHPGGLVLLDHEVAHLGDPAFDVGFALTHLLSKANHLPAHRSALVAAARRFWEVYHPQVLPRGWARGLEERSARHTVGCLLARVAGRSPLEYLTAEERAVQGVAAVALTRGPPGGVEDLIDRFTECLP